MREYKKETAPTTVLSSAIEQVEQMGDYKVMVALVDLDRTKPKPKEERLHTFCDIKSEKLRKVIYREIEKEFNAQKENASKTASQKPKIEQEKNGIISKLANVIIAPEDYVEGDKKYFTFDEACAIEKKLDNGWRLPTRSEWALICEEFGQKDGRLDTDTLMKQLKVKYGGYVYIGSLNDVGSDSYYWSQTSKSDTYAYNLHFYSSYVYPSYVSHRWYGYLVRLVKDI